MPTYKAELSVSSIDALLKNIKAYQKKIEAAPQKIVASLADYGKNEIAQNISGVQDKDGNYLAEAGSYAFGNTGFAYMQGEQAAFLEFGTGVAGQSSPHPQAGESGWNYNAGKKVRGSGYWSYFDKARNRWVSTKGIPAQMPVLRAAMAMRRKIKEAAKEALK